MYDEDGLARLLHDLILSAVTIPYKNFTTHQAYVRRLQSRHTTLHKFSKHPIIEVFATLYGVDEEMTRAAIEKNASIYAKLLEQEQSKTCQTKK